MKLHASLPAVTSVFTGYGDGYVEVNARPVARSVIVMADREPVDWNVARFEDLTVEHFERIADLAPELVLFGSGPKIRFPHPKLLAALHGRGIGVETMDVQAACRTYNVLVAEDRRVAAALILGAGQP